MRLFVRNTVRRQHTRGLRQTSATRHRFKQILCNGTIRLVRNRPVPISEEKVKEHWDELSSLSKAGVVEIREGGANGLLFKFEKESAAQAPIPAPEPPKVKEEAKSPDRMTKAELVVFATELLGGDKSEFEQMTKRQLVEKLS